MAEIQWPTYPQQMPSSMGGGTQHVRLEVMSVSVQPAWPGQRTIKAEFSNKELVFNVSPSEYVGSITFAPHNRNSPAHTVLQAFLAEMMDNPGENWSELDWQHPSIGTLNSTTTAASPVMQQNNDQIASISSASGGVARLTNIRTAFGDSIQISTGEHFGANQQTHKIIHATPVQGQAGQWDIRTVPAYPAQTATVQIYKRHFLPVRFIGGQYMEDPEHGNIGGPWSVQVVEQQVD